MASKKKKADKPTMVWGKAIKHEIKIMPSENKGFIVEVGCCKRVYTSADKLVADLAVYLKDPAGEEERQGGGDSMGLSFPRLSPFFVPPIT